MNRLLSAVLMVALSGCVTPLTKRQPSPFEQRLDRCEREIERREKDPSLCRYCGEKLVREPRLFFRVFSGIRRTERQQSNPKRCWNCNSHVGRRLEAEAAA